MGGPSGCSRVLAILGNHFYLNGLWVARVEPLPASAPACMRSRDLSLEICSSSIIASFRWKSILSQKGLHSYNYGQFCIEQRVVLDHWMGPATLVIRAPTRVQGRSSIFPDPPLIYTIMYAVYYIRIIIAWIIALGFHPLKYVADPFSYPGERYSFFFFFNSLTLSLFLSFPSKLFSSLPYFL